MSTSSLLFILFSFYFLTICANFPFLLVPPDKILMPSLRLQSRVCSARRTTIATATNPEYNMTGRGYLLCLSLLVGRGIWGYCLERIIAVLPLVGHHSKFLITPYYPVLITFCLSDLYPLLFLSPCSMPHSLSMRVTPPILPEAPVGPPPFPTCD